MCATYLVGHWQVAELASGVAMHLAPGGHLRSAQGSGLSAGNR